MTLGTPADKIVPGRGSVTADTPDLVVDLETILPELFGSLDGKDPLEAAVDLINRLWEYGWQVARMPE